MSPASSEKERAGEDQSRGNEHSQSTDSSQQSDDNVKELRDKIGFVTFVTNQLGLSMSFVNNVLAEGLTIDDFEGLYELLLPDETTMTSVMLATGQSQDVTIETKNAILQQIEDHREDIQRLLVFKTYYKDNMQPHRPDGHEYVLPISNSCCNDVKGLITHRIEEKVKGLN